MGKTPLSTPAARIRLRFSLALNHRSVAQTWTPNSRCRKIDDAARPQPRSRTRMPGLKSIFSASHSVSQREFAPPLTLARIHSRSYFADRGNCWLVTGQLLLPDWRHLGAAAKPQ